ncbi:MAG: PAAR domain-containing protein [Pseudomonadota bacterium]
MKNHGIGVIRLHDKTDHGGTVISASSGTHVLGELAALDADMTHCPRCKGNFAIKARGNGASHEGRPYAYDGDIADCGARLITSLS